MASACSIVLEVQTGPVNLRASGEVTTDSLGASLLSFSASNSPHWSSLGAPISKSPDPSSALDQLVTVLVATSAVPLE